MRYYEIGFYGEGHEKDWTFYIKSETELNNDQVIAKLQNKYMGVDGLQQHHIDNIDCINKITAEEFTSCCSIPA
ncbi:hypothetical protein D3C74_358840 [compost metagenome]